MSLSLGIRPGFPFVPANFGAFVSLAQGPQHGFEFAGIQAYAPLAVQARSSVRKAVRSLKSF